MAEPTVFYRQQAENCAKSAANAALDNQREIFLRSERAWQALAERTAVTSAERLLREARSAETREAAHGS